MDPFIQLDSGDIDKATVSAMARDLIERHQKYLGQLDVIGTFFDIISLVKALPAFIHLTTVLISYFDDTTADGPLGYREKDTAPTRAFWGVVKALQHCHFEIEILTIDAWHPMSLVRKVCSGLNPPWREEMWEEGEQWGTGISSDSDATGLPTRISPPGNHQIANVVGFLTSLTLSNIWPQRVELGWQKCILLDILMHCQRLEKLCIELVVPPGSARSGSLSGMLWARSEAYRKFVYPPLLCLKDLELKCGGDGAFLSTCLMPLFRGRNGTLKKLKLSGFYVKSNVVSRIEWDEYFGHLASDLRLEEVRLDKLKTSRGDMFYRSPEELRRWEGWLMHGPDAGTGTLWPRID